MCPAIALRATHTTTHMVYTTVYMYGVLRAILKASNKPSKTGGLIPCREDVCVAGVEDWRALV